MKGDGYDVTEGAGVVITDASGVEWVTTALSGPTKGHSMVVVWVNNPRFDGTGWDPTPWPVESVRLGGGSGVQAVEDV